VSIEAEVSKVRSLLKRVATIEYLASTLDEGDERQAILRQLVRDELDDSPSPRPVIAAKLLGISKATVRRWVDAGVLKRAAERPRLLLDPISVHTVSKLLSDLRVAGEDQQLLDAVIYQLSDEAVLDGHDPADALQQPRQGQKTHRPDRPPSEFNGPLPRANTTETPATRR
jgi:hypothetical protein